MNKPEVVVIDYGIGNLLSVCRGLEHCGAIVNITADPDSILSAERVVLPGVGAFADGMAELQRLDLDTVIQKVANEGIPLLGICLGMQMLLDESEEFGTTKGLGLIPGKVIPVPLMAIDGQTQKIPHIGWNSLELPEKQSNWDGTLLQGVKPGDAVYFVHSFMASTSEPEHCIANCNYGGAPISAVICRKNIFGCQFHPEKSGKIGLNVLRKFLRT